MDNNTIVARINAIFDNLQHLENSQLRLLFDKWNKRSTEVEEEERLFHIFPLKRKSYPIYLSATYQMIMVL
jgi:hypothetical protein